MHVLNAAAPLSAEHGLEVAGSIYETPEGLFRYTFPRIGEVSCASLTIRYRGYHPTRAGNLCSRTSSKMPRTLAITTTIG